MHNYASMHHHVGARRRSGARPRRCAATCRASGLAALMTEFCGSGCRPEGACNRPSRRSCGLSAPNSLDLGVLRIAKSPGKIWGEPSRALRTILRNASPSWSGPRFHKREDVRSRPQPKFLKVWLRFFEEYLGTELHAQPVPPPEITPSIGACVELRISCCPLRRAAIRTRFPTRCCFRPAIDRAPRCF